MTRLNIRNYPSCLSFPGASSSYVLLKSGTILAGSTNFTITAWINFSASGSPAAYSPPIYCERASTGNDILKFNFGASNGINRGKLEFTYRDDAGTLTQVRSTNSLNFNGWNHVVLVKAGTDYTFYVNGASAGSGTFSTSDTFTNSGMESRIGGDRADSTNSLCKGRLCDMALFTTNLSDTDISAMYLNGTYPSTGIVGRWVCDDGSGTSLTDSVGSNTGTLEGSVTWETSTPMITRSLVP